MLDAVGRQQPAQHGARDCARPAVRGAELGAANQVHGEWRDGRLAGRCHGGERGEARAQLCDASGRRQGARQPVPQVHPQRVHEQHAGAGVDRQSGRPGVSVRGGRLEGRRDVVEPRVVQDAERGPDGGAVRDRADLGERPKGQVVHPMTGLCVPGGHRVERGRPVGGCLLAEGHEVGERPGQRRTAERVPDRAEARAVLRVQRGDLPARLLDRGCARQAEQALAQRGLLRGVAGGPRVGMRVVGVAEEGVERGSLVEGRRDVRVEPGRLRVAGPDRGPRPLTAAQQAGRGDRGVLARGDTVGRGAHRDERGPLRAETQAHLLRVVDPGEEVAHRVRQEQRAQARGVEAAEGAEHGHVAVEQRLERLTDRSPCLAVVREVEPEPVLAAQERLRRPRLPVALPPPHRAMRQLDQGRERMGGAGGRLELVTADTRQVQDPRVAGVARGEPGGEPDDGGRVGLLLARQHRAQPDRWAAGRVRVVLAEHQHRHCLLNLGDDALPGPVRVRPEHRRRRGGVRTVVRGRTAQRLGHLGADGRHRPTAARAARRSSRVGCRSLCRSVPSGLVPRSFFQ